MEYVCAITYPPSSQCNDAVMSDAHLMATTKLRFDSSVRQIHQASVFWLVFPKEKSPKRRLLHFFLTHAVREKILSRVGSSNMLITMLSAERWPERGRRGIAKRSEDNYYHPAQWLPNCCCQKQQLVWLSFLLLPFLTLFFDCLAKLLLPPFFIN